MTMLLPCRYRIFQHRQICQKLHINYLIDLTPNKIVAPPDPCHSDRSEAKASEVEEPASACERLTSRASFRQIPAA
jgi:hypothetical protein